MTGNATHLIVLIVIAVVWLVLWILAVRSILRHANMSSFERGVWIAIVIIFPFIGVIVWAAWGSARKRPATTTD